MLWNVIFERSNYNFLYFIILQKFKTCYIFRNKCSMNNMFDGYVLLTFWISFHFYIFSFSLNSFCNFVTCFSFYLCIYFLFLFRSFVSFRSVYILRTSLKTLNEHYFNVTGIIFFNKHFEWVFIFNLTRRTFVHNFVGVHY